MSAALIVLTNYLPIPAGDTDAFFFTLKDDEVYYSLSGAASFGFVTQSISVGRTYRNELPASYIGRKWFNIVLGENTALGIDNYAGVWMSEGNLVESSVPIAQMIDIITTHDDRYSATPPHDAPLNITYMCFVDGATGAGNCIAFFPASQFDQFSPAPPTRY